MADSCVESKPSKYLFMNNIRSSSGSFSHSCRTSIRDKSSRVSVFIQPCTTLVFIHNIQCFRMFQSAKKGFLYNIFRCAFITGHIGNIADQLLKKQLINLRYHKILLTAFCFCDDSFIVPDIGKIRHFFGISLRGLNRDCSRLRRFFLFFPAEINSSFLLFFSICLAEAKR